MEKINTNKQSENKNMGDKNLLFSYLSDACENGYKQLTDIYVLMGMSGLKLQNLSRAAAVLDVLIEWYSVNNLSFSNYTPVNIACEWLNGHGAKFFTIRCLPKTHIRLMKKLRDYLSVSKLVQKVVLVRKAPEITEKERWWHNIALSSLMQDVNCTQASILRKIKEVSEVNGKICPQKKTLRVFLRKKRGIRTVSTQFNTRVKSKK